MMNFALKTRGFVSKTRNCALKTGNFVLKTGNFAGDACVCRGVLFHDFIYVSADNRDPPTEVCADVLARLDMCVNILCNMANIV